MSRIDDLILFTRLAELKSFTAVAEEQQLSRSLVSKRISALEDRMGVQLLNRTTRRLQLTAAGQTLYEYGVKIENLVEQAELAVGEIRNRPQGVLNINAPISYGQLMMPPLITGFLQAYPDVRINLSLTDQYVDVSEYDVVIRIGRLKDSAFKARKLGETRLRVIASHAYLQRQGTPATPQDLQQHNCLLYRYMGAGGSEWRFDGPMGREVVLVKGNFTAENGVPLFKAAEAGLGVTMQPDFVIKALDNGCIADLLQDYTRERLGIYAMYPATRKPPLNTRVFLDYIVRALETNNARTHK